MNEYAINKECRFYKVRIVVKLFATIAPVGGA